MKAHHFLASLLSSAQATKVLLPLYVYPEVTETFNPWQSIYDAISNNPDVEFQIILSVDSGPGDATPGYNEDWISEVPKLNAFSNVHTFGYVPLWYGTRAGTSVVQDVSNWAGWNTYTAANISVNGIFFDEVPNHTSTKKQKVDLANMTSYVSAAKKSFATNPSFEIIFNPGTRVAKGLSAGYFGMADHILVYEQFAANYTTDNPMGNGYIPAGMSSKSIVVLHDFVESGLPDDTVKSWLDSWMQAGVSSVNILNYDYEQCNSIDSPASLNNVAQILGGGS